MGKQTTSKALIDNSHSTVERVHGWLFRFAPFYVEKLILP